MKRVGFLGCGKIGKALVSYISEREDTSVAFIQDPCFKNDTGFDGSVITEETPEEEREKLYENADLIVECANARVLSENLEKILKHSDVMLFSVTAFSDPEFEKKAADLSRRYKKNIYIPHGAVLGMDGIFDGRKVWTQVTIETIKNPKSLGRDDKERSVLYDGPTREACHLFPRNVNVHATIAMAGIGFDKTRSRIISDPAVSTNAHNITLKGDGIEICFQVSSFAAGAVSGAYTPYSACGSLERILKDGTGNKFV